MSTAMCSWLSMTCTVRARAPPGALAGLVGGGEGGGAQAAQVQQLGGGAGAGGVGTGLGLNGLFDIQVF